MELRSGALLNVAPSPVVEPSWEEGGSSRMVLTDDESVLLSNEPIELVGDDLAGLQGIKKVVPLAVARAAARKAAKEKEEPVVKEEEEDNKCIAIVLAKTRCTFDAKKDKYCMRHYKMVMEIKEIEEKKLLGGDYRDVEETDMGEEEQEEAEVEEAPTPEPNKMDDDDELAMAFGAATIA